MIIQPIEFNYRHRNAYGYLALGSFVLVLINYILIMARLCQYSLVNGFFSYDLTQSFHLFALVVALMVFVLSYFDFAAIIYDFKLLFNISAALIFVCSILLVYCAISITSAPCMPVQSPLQGLKAILGAVGMMKEDKSIFSDHDGVSITVFVFDILAAAILGFASHRFYQRR